MKKTKLWKKLAALAVGAAMLFSKTAAYAQEEQPVGQAETVLRVSGQEADLTISSERELNEFAQKVNNGNTYAGKLIKLTQDIQFDGVTVNNFTPIGGEDLDSSFMGVFDGCGYTISGIDVTDTSNGCVGLFSMVGTGGTVKNLTIKDSGFTGASYVGAIAGRNYGLIENCHNRDVNVEGRRPGGIAGYCVWSSSAIINCSSSGDIKGSSVFSAGGIAADCGGQIINCCNIGNILTTSDYFTDGIGGIVGYSDAAMVQNCYNAGIITDTSSSNIGGIAGCVLNISIMANSFCSEESAVANFAVMKGTEKNNKALPASEMKTESFVSQLNANRGSNADWLEWEIRSDESPYPLPVKRVNLSECEIDLSSTSMVYDGTEKRPEVVVTYDGKVLENGVHYSLVYQNNVNMGTGVVVIEGIGRYTDSVTLTFTIKAMPGDVNLDDRVDLNDALLALKAALGAAELTPEQEQAADVDGDGSVKLFDVQTILKAALRIIEL